MDGTVVQTRIPQVSRGGCLIYPPLPPHQSPNIKLSFALGDSEAPINCKGEIVYTIAARGSGVAFTEISIYNQERITMFFEARSGAEETAGA